MKKTIFFLLLLILSYTNVMAADTPTSPDPTGLWLTENQRSAILIEKCGASICGNLAWIVAGGMQTDTKNPDKTKQGQPLCGLPILWGFTQNMKNPKIWESGKIYKADDGDTYNATVSVIDDNTLSVRGYIGISLLGKTQKLKRASAVAYPPCKK